MEVRLSSARFGELDVGGLSAKTGRRGGSPRCALSARHMSFEDLLRGLPPCLAAASPAADLLGHGPVLGDDLLGLGRGDRCAVDIADHIRHPPVHDRPGPLGQVGGDHADRAEVVLAALDHLHVVEAGELGVLAAGGVGGADQVVRSSRLPALEMGWPLRSVLPASVARSRRTSVWTSAARSVKATAGWSPYNCRAARAAASQWVARCWPCWPPEALPISRASLPGPAASSAWGSAPKRSSTARSAMPSSPASGLVGSSWRTRSLMRRLWQAPCWVSRSQARTRRSSAARSALGSARGCSPAGSTSGSRARVSASMPLDLACRDSTRRRSWALAELTR